MTSVAFGAFNFDPVTRELLAGGRRVHLSPKAFDLLRLLIERRPAVVSKQEILDQVWEGAFVGDASLSVVIAEIRQALGDDPRDARFIRTVHRVGYAFCAAVTPTALRQGSGLRCWLTWHEQTFPLAPGDHVIGRDPGCDIWIDASGVSRRHALIVVSAGGATIEDLASSNGTFVGGHRVREARPLSDRDAIEVGAATLTYREWSSDRAPKTEKIVRTGGQGAPGR